MSPEARTRSYRNVLGSTLAFTLLWLAVVGPSPAFGDTVAGDPGTAEMDFAARINQARFSAGLPALVVQTKLSDEARSWSLKMREISGQNVGPNCKLSHNPRLASEVDLGWKTLGENVACSAGDAAATHQAFMESPAHRQNILDPKFDSIGVAVEMTGATMFVTEVFMQSKITAPKLAKSPSKSIRTRKKRIRKSQ